MSPRILVVGLGNPILGDDGVGWHVAADVANRLSDAQAVVDQLALGGLSLMERLIGYDEVIIIDAMQMEGAAPGTVARFSLSEMPDLTTGHTTAVHDMSLQTALDLGRQMGADLPQHIQIVAVTAEKVYDFSEEMTPAVATAVPQAVRMVLSMLQELGVAV